MDIERICAKVHVAYCTELLNQGKEPYWTRGDYDKLDEPTKEFDRVTVRAVLDAIELELQAENERLREMKSITNAIQCPDGDCCGTLGATYIVGMPKCNECGQLWKLVKDDKNGEKEENKGS